MRNTTMRIRIWKRCLEEMCIRDRYQRAAMRAEELESLAAGLRRLSGEEYESALSDIRCAWRGESAQQYLRRANELSQEIMHCSAELLMSAQSLRAEAAAVRDAKKRAAVRAN